MARQADKYFYAFGADNFQEFGYVVLADRRQFATGGLGNHPIDYSLRNIFPISLIQAPLPAGRQEIINIIYFLIISNPSLDF